MLMITDEIDLSRMLTIQDLLHEIRVILILPSSERGILAMAHGLRPRFVAFVGETLENLPAVRHKIDQGGRAWYSAAQGRSGR